MGEDLPRSHSMTLESQDKGSGRVQAWKPGFESRSAVSHLTSETEFPPQTQGVIIVPTLRGP